ncbi:MAG: hypothetical protein IPP77_11265 [Bacteroidetes bacterium]|nr:hypothetical protein [Bacteroidota bacterium]
MKTVPDIYLYNDIDVSLKLNPFISKIIKLLVSKKKLKHGTTKELLAFIGEDDFFELYAEPEEIFDFDASMLPDGLDTLVLFKPRIDKHFDACGLARRKNNLCFSLWISEEEELKYASVLNPIRLLNEMHKRSNEYGFLADNWFNLEESLNIRFHYVVPAKGNMLLHFNKAEASLQKLYSRIRKQLIKEAQSIKK